MVESEYSTNIYKHLNINIETVLRNPEMFKFVSDHLKTKKMCKRAVEKLRFLIDLFLINLRLNKCVIKLF